MVQRRPQLNDQLEDFQVVADIDKYGDGQLANFDRGVVELSDQKTDEPGLGNWRVLQEIRKVLGSEETDVLVTRVQGLR